MLSLVILSAGLVVADRIKTTGEFKLSKLKPATDKDRTKDADARSSRSITGKTGTAGFESAEGGVP
jgi:hypothetical protein